MPRTSLYSRSPEHGAGAAASTPSTPPSTQKSASGVDGAQPVAASPAGWRARLGQGLRRRERWLWAAAMLGLALLAGWPAWTARVKAPLDIEQIDAALREAFVKEPLQSAGLAAYEAILPSVVRVVGEQAQAPADAASAAKRKPGAAKGKADAEDEDEASTGRSVGTGVVIVDKGLILTNLHVVEGASRITVTFADGSESEARVVSLQRENDLAVLQALTIPDDLHAATMRSTAGLAPGEAVLAVGFPFGIGPSASQGVVSGLKREFRSPEGKRILTNLIQFDAAANPGNSGGPLITLDGHVVGIVTAIMNPSKQRTFIGIGFAVPIENAAAGAGLPPF